MAYSKLHSSVVNSSLWCAPDPVRLLFVTLLAICDADGCIYGSRGGIARQANIKYPQFPDPFETLMEPDADSSDMKRHPENKGRRIIEIEGGFQLINYAFYRALRNADDRKVQNRQAQQRFRLRHKPPSASVSQGKPRSAYAEAEADAKKSTPQPPKGGEVSDGFDLFWAEYPNKQAKIAAKRAWLKIKPDEREEVMRGLKAWKVSQSWQKDDGQFIPHPATFLNQRRWEDSPKAAKVKQGFKRNYVKLPPLPTDAEFAAAAVIARRETEALRQKLKHA